MTTVYIINKGVHDHSDAKRFGEIEYLTEGAINRYATSNMYREFTEKLKTSQPCDYLLPTGLTIMNMIACSIFVLLHGRLNLLIFKTCKKGGAGRYIERRLVFEKLNNTSSKKCEKEN